MRRREFITLLGGMALGWPRVVHAQQPANQIVGLLSGLAQKPLTQQVSNIYRGLKDAGFTPGQNLKVEERWADAQYERLPAMAHELVALKVNAIATIGGNVAALAAKAATSKIPIIFATADDPVATGLVPSFSRPAGNLTGITWMGTNLQAKYLEVLHELLPNVSTVGVLLNPARATAGNQFQTVREAANIFGKKIRLLNATNPGEIDVVFSTIAAEHIGALIISVDPLFSNRREQIVALAARGAVPTMYFLRDFVAVGGLMSYGAILSDAFYQVGVYTGRVLKGERPSDLPVQQSTKVELVINLQTAKALGLNIPITLLGRADEVIE